MFKEAIHPTAWIPQTKQYIMASVNVLCQVTKENLHQSHWRKQKEDLK